ncbi:MAG: thioredoxin domain-containing protein [Gammaproteobacteria bacterium]|nr:thioredoxin domain-containing protein [Gammaproteobacteria bacterium]
MIQSLKRIYFLLLIACLPVFVAQAGEAALKDHPSPYLSMHSEDPVDWQLWGKGVLDRAKAENKLIYVSIGYFSCHWCHVMQNESYKDPAVGALLNKDFIAVKVDRELRPELDRRLIRFVEEVRGQAGWPLNVFVTPDGYPVTGFTYLPRDNFYQVLGQLNEQWLDRHEKIKTIARQYFEQTESSETRSTLVELKAGDNGKVADAFVSQAMTIADELLGGFGKSMKFPSYPQLNSLLKMIRVNPDIDSDVTDFVQLTLDSMASYHLMDHINNGFFRYSTDPDWQTPHFEKMLYDNAQLAALYFDAELLWPDKGYAEVGLKTIDFMIKFLAHESGGFNASLSAVDEDNIEGAGYLWSKKELQGALSKKEFSHLRKVWNLTEVNDEEFQPNPLLGIGSDQQHEQLNHQIQVKLQKIKKPVMPVDNKRLASWNALALTALVKAQDFDKNHKLQKTMHDLFNYMQHNFITEDASKAIQVIRFAGQQQSAETTLEDYAQLAHAVQLYASKTSNKKADELVASLVNEAFSRFYRVDRWIRDTESLIPGDTGDLIIQDAVLQSPSSLLLETVFMMKNPNPVILQKTNELKSRLTKDVLNMPYYYGSSIMLGKLQNKNAVK